jgi:8-oxo-dGTP diphosphatase
VPTVDIIIELPGDRIILIERKNPPPGWALPGGFVDYGESLENAAIREAKEETSLDITLVRQFHAYSNPDRDARLHTISTVFIAKSGGEPHAGDDAKNLKTFHRSEIPHNLAFDHDQILDDYLKNKY